MWRLPLCPAVSLCSGDNTIDSILVVLLRPDGVVRTVHAVAAHSMPTDDDYGKWNSDDADANVDVGVVDHDDGMHHSNRIH